MKRKHYVNDDGSQGMRMYQVELYIQSYKQVEDAEAFFAQFK